MSSATLSPWRNPQYLQRDAWVTKNETKTYGDLLKDLNAFQVLSESEANKVVKVYEDSDVYQCVLKFLAAWELNKTICVIPASWPESLKEATRVRIDAFSKSLPEGCFYILPTSGSTGVPKLVVITRNNWLAFLNGLAESYTWNRPYRVALCFEPVFDPFIAMVFLTLSQGSCLVPLPSEDRFNIFSFIQKNAIDVWASVPSLVALNWKRKDIEELSHLKHTMFTGEALTPELANGWRTLAPESELENLYGPVECTVWAVRKKFRALSIAPHSIESVPIGNAFSSLVGLKIDHGELLIEGPQVAVGYLSESGIASFNESYRTGDLVEKIGEEFYFLGRKDQQVKILGQRVELAAIEDVFLKQTGYKAVSCVNKESMLCLVSDRDFDVSQVFKAMQTGLPKSHVPRLFFKITIWPMTSSGKIDRSQVEKLIAEGKLFQLSQKGAV